ncbi:MAG: C25 family cysteine peptidase [Anaerolineae bacterium]
MRFIVLFLLLLLAACSSPPPTITQGWKIDIAEPGLYRVSSQELTGFQAVVGSHLDRLTLTHHGQAVPVQLDTTGTSAAIIFYGDPDPERFSPNDVYSLKMTDGAGPRMSTRPVEAQPRAAPPQTFSATLVLRQNLVYLPDGVGQQHWFWEQLTAPMARTITATLTAAAPGNATIQVGMAGLSTELHRLRVLVNDQPVGDANWPGQTLYIYQGKTANLHNGVNRITLQVPAAPDQVDVSFLQAITLTYPRRVTAQDNALALAGGPDVSAQGFRGDAFALYDISDPGNPQRLQGFGTQQANGAGSLTWHDSENDRRYLALGTEAYKHPVSIHTVSPNTLRAPDQADYIVIAPAALMDALQPLIQRRSAQGLHVRTVDVESVYDAFSDGAPDPHAIRDFLQFAQDRWNRPAPRLVLLVGKASYDYLDNLHAPNPNLVPTYLVSTPHLGAAASDDWFAPTSAQDSRPALAIGRIPAKTPAQVKTVVDKILAYEETPRTADWLHRAVLVTDNTETTFDEQSNGIAALLPQNVAPHKIYLSAFKGDRASARSQLIEQWNSGSLMVMYMGHGSITTWAEGPLFSDKNLDEIQNGARLPILITPTCLDGYFYQPNQDSLSEQLLFKSDGGIVAALAPTGVSLSGVQAALMRHLMANLFAQPAPTLGEAIRAAKGQMDITSPDQVEVMNTFVLLGDPAMKWTPPQ